MPTRSPEVSVCIPTYNRSQMLRESALSVLRQTFGDFELIVSDNASEDNTESVVRSLKDERIVYTKTARNVGPLENMNRCLRLCRGRFIAILPDDDIMLPENLTQKTAVLEANPEAGLVHSRYDVIDERCRTLKANTHWGHGPDLGRDGFEDRRELLARVSNRINLPTVVFRRACYERLGEFTGGFAGELGMAFDYEYWMRIAIYYEILFLTTPLVKWRIHNDSLTNKHLAGNQVRRLREVLAMKHFLLARHCRDIPRDLREEILDRLYSRVVSCLESVLDKEVPNPSARRFVLESARMFPGILRERAAWKLLLKSMLRRQDIDRLKRFVAISG